MNDKVMIKWSELGLVWHRLLNYLMQWFGEFSCAVWEKQELNDLAAFLISDYAGFINGEVITIDGGEWLKGAGVFNGLVDLPQEQWDVLAELTRKGGPTPNCRHSSGRTSKFNW